MVNRQMFRMDCKMIIVEFFTNKYSLSIPIIIDHALALRRLTHSYFIFCIYVQYTKYN